jgi:hypothetical protein
MVQSVQSVDRVPFYLFINDSSEPSEVVHYMVDITKEDKKDSYVYKRFMLLHKEKKSHFPYVTDEEFEGLVGDVPKIASTKTRKTVDEKPSSTNKYKRRKTVKKMRRVSSPIKNSGNSDSQEDEEDGSEQDEEDGSEQDEEDGSEQDEEDGSEQDEEDGSEQDEEDEEDGDEMTEQGQIEAFADFMEHKMVSWNQWPRAGVPISALQHIKWWVNFSAS